MPIENHELEPRSFPVSHELIEWLIAPEDLMIPAGKRDSLSKILYQAAENDTESVMAELVDVTGTMMRLDQPGNELDEGRVFRLLHLFADMPNALPLEGRLAAWRHLLDQNWLYFHAGNLNLSRAMFIAYEDSDIGSDLFRVAHEVYQSKIDDTVRLNGGVELLPTVVEGGEWRVIPFLEASATIDRQNQYDLYVACQAAIGLGMAIHELEPLSS